MLRRVARACRAILICAGVVCLLLFLIGLGVIWHYRTSLDSGSFTVSGVGATLFLKLHLDGDLEYIPGPNDIIGDDFGQEFPAFEWRRNRPFTPPWHVLWPAIEWRVNPYHRSYDLTLPLWLPAFICLAWPVTSFIIARRRRRRGFPIDVKSGVLSAAPKVHP